MNKKVFNEIVNIRKLKPNKIKNAIWAFLCGGFVGLFGQLLLLLFTNTFSLEENQARAYMYFTIILITNILTALGIFDMYSTYAGAGAFIPISGEASRSDTQKVITIYKYMVIKIEKNALKNELKTVKWGKKLSFVVKSMKNWEKSLKKVDENPNALKSI